MQYGDRVMRTRYGCGYWANWVEIQDGETYVIHVWTRGELQTIQSNHGKVAVVRQISSLYWAIQGKA